MSYKLVSRTGNEYLHTTVTVYGQVEKFNPVGLFVLFAKNNNPKTSSSSHLEGNLLSKTMMVL